MPKAKSIFTTATTKFEEMIEHIKHISFKDSSNVEVVDLRPTIGIIEEYKEYWKEESKQK